MRLNTSVATGKIVPEDPPASRQAGIEPLVNPSAMRARTPHHSLGYLDALPVDPEDIKRREYLGISSFLLGLVALLSGFITLVFLIPLSIVLLSLGCAAAAAGMLVLANIPNIVTLSEASA